jgi:hypothetical protein
MRFTRLYALSIAPFQSSILRMFEGCLVSSRVADILPKKGLPTLLNAFSLCLRIISFSLTYHVTVDQVFQRWACGPYLSPFYLNSY